MSPDESSSSSCFNTTSTYSIWPTSSENSRRNRLSSALSFMIWSESGVPSSTGGSILANFTCTRSTVDRPSCVIPTRNNTPLARRNFAACVRDSCLKLPSDPDTIRRLGRAFSASISGLRFDDFPASFVSLAVRSERNIECIDADESNAQANNNTDCPIKGGHCRG